IWFPHPRSGGEPSPSANLFERPVLHGRRRSSVTSGSLTARVSSTRRVSKEKGSRKPKPLSSCRGPGEGFVFGEKGGGV
ncbi:unnamed protein product, partial [Ascophyllum nodosum]